MIAALHGARRASRPRRLRGVLIDAEGPHFSFGASVEEHLPDRCAAMLRGFHALLLRLVEARCRCWWRCAASAWAAGWNSLAPAPDLRRTRREVRPAGDQARRLRPRRFVPAALAHRTQPAAEDLLLSGAQHRRGGGAGAGPGHGVVDDPEAAALACFDEHLADKSAAALRLRRARGRGPIWSSGCAPARRGGTPLPRRTHVHPRRHRGPGRLPRQAPRQWEHR